MINIDGLARLPTSFRRHREKEPQELTSCGLGHAGHYPYE